MNDITIILWALSITGNVIVAFPVLFDNHTEYPHGNHGRGETVYEHSMCKRHFGLILGLMGVPLCIFLN